MPGKQTTGLAGAEAETFHFSALSNRAKRCSPALSRSQAGRQARFDLLSGYDAEISPGSSRAGQESWKRSLVNGNLSFTRFCSATESHPRAHLFRTQLPFIFSTRSFFPRLARRGEGGSQWGTAAQMLQERARELCLASRLGPGQAECK